MNPIILTATILFWILALFFLAYGFIKDEEAPFILFIVLGVIALVSTIISAENWQDYHPISKAPNSQNLNVLSTNKENNVKVE